MNGKTSISPVWLWRDFRNWGQEIKYYNKRCPRSSYCSGNSKGFGSCELGTMEAKSMRNIFWSSEWANKYSYKSQYLRLPKSVQLLLDHCLLQTFQPLKSTHLKNNVLIRAALLHWLCLSQLHFLSPLCFHFLTFPSSLTALSALCPNTPLKLLSPVASMFLIPVFTFSPCLAWSLHNIWHSWLYLPLYPWLPWHDLFLLTSW